MSRRGWCQHYDGRFFPNLEMRETCKAGVRYLDVIQVKSASGFPCVGRGPDTCPKYLAYSEEQIAEEDVALATFLAQLAAGKCPQCGKPIEPSTVSGRCRYGACGHRIGRVR